ncbi:MAG: hypothetical protein J1F32_05610 [Erysipelotrichales bacterium]|nr:hypothetical protein [Erysipelotrichales bacterium]
MDAYGMSYEELFEYVKQFETGQRLDVLEYNYELIISELEDLYKDKQIINELLVKGLSTFMMANGQIENDDFYLLNEFMKAHFTNDHLISIIEKTDYNDTVSMFSELIANLGFKFLDRFVLMGMVLCSTDGNIAEKEFQLADKYVSVLQNDPNNFH